MPKVHSITITLDGDKQVYQAGDVVSGKWTVNLGDSFSVVGVRVALHGAAYARWADDFDSRKDDKVGYEKFTAQWRTVFGTKLGESGPNHTLTAGEHEYRFSFRLPPDRLPSSYEGKYGAIRYWVLFQINRPMFRFNIERVKGITVLDRLDVNDQVFAKPVSYKMEKTIAKVLVVGNQGTVNLQANTNRGAYCPGEKIILALVANNDSDKDLGPVKASLVQRVTSYASGDEKVKDTVLRTVTGKPLEKGGKRTWNGQTLTVDAIPPSTRARACHIVKVSYNVKVFVDIPKLQGGDAVVRLPITIGTVPQGYRPTPQQTPAANSIEVIDVSSAITYTQCNAGFEWFNKGKTDVFNNFQYTPWCSYVPNFRLPAPKAAPPTPKAAAAPKPNVVTPIVVTPKAVTPRVAKGIEALSLVPQTPSAPPAEPLNPPSYEDVISGIADYPIERPNEVSETTSLTSATENASSKGVYLLLRFPDTFVSVFRTRLVEFGARMYGRKGCIIALAPQVIVTRGSWSPRTSIALFMFETKESAEQWFTEFSDSCSLQGLIFTEAVLTDVEELHQNEKSLFFLAVTECPRNWKSPEVKELRPLLTQLMVPLRQKYDGVKILGTMKSQRLRGNWPIEKRLLIITEWQSLEARFQYQNERETEKYKRAVELINEVFKAETGAVFQSEDLAFMEDMQAALTGEDCESDNRKEAP